MDCQSDVNVCEVESGDQCWEFKIKQTVSTEVCFEFVELSANERLTMLRGLVKTMLDEVDYEKFDKLKVDSAYFQKTLLDLEGLADRASANGSI